MKNWDRTYKLIAGKAGETGFEIGGKPGASLHIKFELEKTDVASNNTGTISIWNLNDEHVSILEQKDCMIALYAGYGNTLPLLFSGTITNPETSLESADRKTDIDVVDGRVAVRDTYISLSYSGDTFLNAIFNDCISQMGVTCVYGKKAQALISSAKIPNGFAFIGSAAECMKQICNAYGLQWSIQNGVCEIHSPDEAVSTQAYLLNENAGLIGVPKRIALSAESKTDNTTGNKTTYGYEINYFLNAAINVNDLILLESKKASGVFRVKNIKISGDNMEGDWLCTAKIVEVGHDK